MRRETAFSPESAAGSYRRVLSALLRGETQIVRGLQEMGRLSPPGCDSDAGFRVWIVFLFWTALKIIPGYLKGF